MRRKAFLIISPFLIVLSSSTNSVFSAIVTRHISIWDCPDPNGIQISAAASAEVTSGTTPIPCPLRLSSEDGT